MYSYRDHRATEIVASHWVRDRSALGGRLRDNPARIAAVLGRRGRGTSRLVMASDFIPDLPESAAQHDNNPSSPT